MIDAGNVSGAEARQPRDFLILLDDCLGLAGNFLGGDFDRNLALHAVFLRVNCFLWDSQCPFRLAPMPAIHTPFI